MAKSSKIHGLMVDKKEIYVYDADDFVNSNTVSRECLLETLKLLKSKSHEVKLQMNKNNGPKLQKNFGIRRNINFMVNFNLETDIVTRTDNEGIKNFIVKAENPFETNLDYIADDKDFFTEQTEDEDEFREISGYETKRREKGVNKSSDRDKEKIKSQEIVLEEKPKSKIKTDPHKLNVEKNTKKKLESQKVIAEAKLNKKEKLNSKEKLNTKNPSEPQKLNTKKKPNSKEVLDIKEKPSTKKKLNSKEKLNTKPPSKPQKVTVGESTDTKNPLENYIKGRSDISDYDEISSTGVSSLKKSIHTLSLVEETRELKQGRSSDPLDFPLPKRTKSTNTTGHFKRNVFANFIPSTKQNVRTNELLLPYHTWMIIKNPCREMRKQVSKRVYREITGQKRRRSSTTVNIGTPKPLPIKPSYLVDNLEDLHCPESVPYKKSSDIKITDKMASDSSKVHTCPVNASDLVNTYFIRAESSSDETSQIF